jgi:uroporphyrinogen-III synthase
MQHLPTLLITRPYPQAERTAMEYRARGWRCILSPALNVTPHSDATQRIATLAQRCNGWIVTSAMALELLAMHRNAHIQPLYVTGEILARKALQAGFTHVQHGNGSASGLLDMFPRHADPALHYGYVHGNHQTLALADILAKRGWQAYGAEIYSSHPAASLTEEAYQALHAHEVTAVSFYSTMTLRAFLTLVTHAGLHTQLRHIDAWCYSAAIAHSVPHGIFASTIVL